MAALEIPLSDPASSPKHIPSEYYYRIPVRPIYRSYPVFDASKLKTEEEWIKAGELVFEAAVATLEDWFDRRRLQDDYVPTGFKGYGVKTRAVKGHEYGLDLSETDRKALIAFLKTL